MIGLLLRIVKYNAEMDRVGETLKPLIFELGLQRQHPGSSLPAPQ